MIYILLLLLLFINLKYRNKKLEIVSIVLMVLISALRYKVGVDFDAYYNIGVELADNANYHRFGIIYRWLYDIGGYLHHYRFFFYATSMIFGSVLFLFNRRDEEFSPVIIFFIFCNSLYFMSFNIIRQSLSMLVFLYSIKYLVKKEYIFFYLACAISFLFHQSAAIYFLAPFFVFFWDRVIKADKAWIYPILLSTLTLLAFVIESSDIIAVVGHFFYEKFSLSLPSYKIELTHILEYLANAVLIFGLIKFFKEKIFGDNNYIKITFYIMYTGMILKCFFTGEAGRVSLGLILVSIIFMSLMYNDKTIVGKKRLILNILIFGFSLSKFLGYLIFNVGEILPYNIF